MLLETQNTLLSFTINSPLTIHKKLRLLNFQNLNDQQPKTTVINNQGKLPLQLVDIQNSNVDLQIDAEPSLKEHLLMPILSGKILIDQIVKTPHTTKCSIDIVLWSFALFEF